MLYFYVYVQRNLMTKIEEPHVPAQACLYKYK